MILGTIICRLILNGVSICSCCSDAISKLLKRHQEKNYLNSTQLSNEDFYNVSKWFVWHFNFAINLASLAGSNVSKISSLNLRRNKKLSRTCVCAVCRSCDVKKNFIYWRVRQCFYVEIENKYLFYIAAPSYTVEQISRIYTANWLLCLSVGLNIYPYLFIHI